MRGHTGRVLVALTLLLATSLAPGCMGLLAARESVEWLRGSAELREVPDSRNLTHTFTQPSVFIHYADGHINVDDDTARLTVSFRTTMPFDDLLATLSPVRYIHAWLENPNGTVVHEWNVSETYNGFPEVIVRPDEGRWEFHVEALAHGVTLAGIEQHDTYTLVVTRVQNELVLPGSE